VATAARQVRVTQAEVAQMAGCSQNTVALALRDSSRVSRERREHIRKLAEQLGYRPNLAARNLVRRRSGLLGMFTGHLDEVRTQLVAQLLTGLHTTEYRPILGVDESRPSPWYEASWIETFRDFRVEAMIPIAWTDEVHLPEWYREVPLIMAAIQPDSTLPCDFVGLDRIDAGRQATLHLLQRGHKRIAAVADAQRRFVVQGYANVMREAGLVTQFVPLPGLAGLEECVTRWRTASERPTALLVLNSHTAVHLAECLHEAGLRVPEDMAIVAYDQLPMAEHLRFQLTTVEQPIAEVAASVITIVRKRLAEPDAPTMHLVLKHELIVRGST